MASSIDWRSIQLINKKTLLGLIPLSEKSIYNMEKRGDFPKRIALTSRNVAWDLKEVTAWVESRKSSGAQAVRPGQTVIVS
jgi:prophage regulatory protein